MKEKSTIFKSSQLIKTFLSHVIETPEKIAIKYHSQAITYSQLNDMVNKLANQLLATQESLFDRDSKPLTMGVMSDNKLEALVSILALLKLGITFVPLNADDPAMRLQYVIAKSGVSLILSGRNTNSTSNASMVLIEDLLNSGSNIKEPCSNVCDDHLAYLLFTSGSTAKNPKGVMQSHNGLTGQISNYTRDLKINSSDNILNLASFTHDQAMVDCFAALLNGATLCLYNSKNLAAPSLHTFMQSNRISIFSSIPSMFELIFEEMVNPDTFPNLRIVTIGGEETKLQHVKLFQQSCPPDSLLINGYGATEISWISSYTVHTKTDLSELSAIPLGYMTDGIDVYLDEHDGIKELCISSDFLSPGYWEDEEANENAFFTDEQTGRRFYRTGDITIEPQNNCYEFKGRKVWHEKISGKRVNLLEIEHGLLEHSNGKYKNCAVTAYGEGDKRKIYAFYERDYPLTSAQYTLLKLEMATSLDKHMLPHKIFWMEKIPTLQNQKIDRQTLPKLVEINLGSNIKYQNLSDEITEVVTAYWFEELDVYEDDILSDSFSNLGGNSLIATKLAKKISAFIQAQYAIQGLISPVISSTQNPLKNS
jgi:acyl-coenzyme A synthetase/AMP-(fatty) acid ligase